MWHLMMLYMLLLPWRGWALICTRHPKNTNTLKSPVDENYVISVTGNPETYILGQEYNVSLNAFNGHRYISYILALENENGDFSYMNDLGRFELNDLIETRFSPNCINMVENTNTNPKTHMHLTWIAPSEPGNGCILIRATVLQHRDVWHMDDGGLTKRICEEVVDDVESQPTASTLNLGPCCACDEARYELTFESIWSRNLHPKDFPARGWQTRFCELVGAAHSSDYRFWESGALASEGVKQYAEHCTSRLLERDFSINFRDQKIRTIIKARGPAYPNLNSKTTASVRVDPVHHMISFASKIEPSPDWIVGVTGLELCLRNCTWLEAKVINLYPWDVGTDAGPSYISPDQPQVPPDVIRRIRSDFPNDPRSPFYDETGVPMKPMAMLTVRRQRIYERRCVDEESNNDMDVTRECLTHPWASWSECSSKCGEGMQYRRRVYKQPELARIYNCNVPQYEERACEGLACGMSEPMRNAGDFDDEFNMGQIPPGYIQQHQQQQQQRRAECQLSNWGSWSPCSVTCGEGYQTRQRQYLNPNAELKCQSVHRLELQETRQCAGRACLGNLNGAAADFETPYQERERGRLPEPENELNIFNRNRMNNNFNREYDQGQVDYSHRESPFDVANLKGTQGSQWGQEQNPAAQWPPQRQVPQQPIAPNFGQIPPRPEDVEQTPWQRPRPGDNYREEQQLRYDNRAPTGAEANPYPDQELNPARTPWQRPGNANIYNRAFDETSGNIGNENNYLSKRCFQMLRTIQPRCQNQTIVGHFWFYNFCADECMLFAADPCDRNVNKFSKWEQCEECRQPEFQMLQEQRSASQECHLILASQQAQQRNRQGERHYSNRWQNNGNQQWG
ncbi:spondin-1 isoform X2 [Drosophila grimshawi]|uniref:Spondin-1 n=1 Tax=Drosophila grimshawi TaxID=7222 RepID=B4JW56_DROGR|nr:spondin-1 isoform X2 [Drosophila grimshawi]EDV98194.1 GH22806 [Drosophila grimshawi]